MFGMSMSTSMFTIAGARARLRPGAVAAALLLPVLAACATSAGQGSDPFVGAEDADSDEIELLVRNLNFNQVTVYTARGGSLQRLGTVGGKNEATFRLRWHLPDIQLRVRQLAGEDFYTETIPVSPGEFLELIVPSR